ncbi:Crp/Fnr family transcriptional regulator [Sulfitobacter aestuarii]|uniref:Crp/Fnr family transcriptional regulator n=1 Tax=Sulfitobacter aestuarii TaxID=2161676 RepID=A0ABW5U2I4_9RHOB
MTDRSSCLVMKLSRYVTLGPEDRARLAKIEKTERNYATHTDVYRLADRNTELFVVKEGWAFSYVDMPNGRRQIVQLHHPGDIIGLRDVALNCRSTTLSTAEPVTLCPFPKSALDLILRESPRLSALLLSIALREQVTFIDLLRAMGRMSAEERIGYLFLDLIARLRITNPSMTDTFRLPLTQSQIADYLGLTNVYVSKTLLQMEQKGYLQRGDGKVRLLREEALIELTDFTNHYDDLDTSWFPDK